jgi:predicted nucleic acid-binding protein
MPALEHAFDEPPPELLYVGTDIFVNYLISTQPHHARCRAFLERLHQGARTTLYVSSLTWLELAHVFTRPSFRDDLAEDLQRRYRVGRWERPEVRRVYLDGLIGEFELLLAQFPWVEVPVAPMVRRVAVTFMAQYGLGSQDATHLASAAMENAADFASFDSIYRRVDDLDLWNDLIYGSPAT